MAKLKWRTERKCICDIKPWGKNPRIINGKPYDDLKKSLHKFGLAEPIAINTDGTVIGGHARLMALQDQSEQYADCYVPDRTLTAKEVEELNIRLNRNMAGEWNWESLANEFEMPDLIEWGFDEKQLVGEDIKTDLNLDNETENPLSGKQCTCPKCGHEWMEIND